MIIEIAFILLLNKHYNIFFFSTKNNLFILIDVIKINLLLIGLFQLF